jgi:hypothetical protein
MWVPGFKIYVDEKALNVNRKTHVEAIFKLGKQFRNLVSLTLPCMPISFLGLLIVYVLLYDSTPRPFSLSSVFESPYLLTSLNPPLCFST